MADFESHSEAIAAICQMLPDDEDEAINLITVACAAAWLTAGYDDGDAAAALLAALGSLRENGFLEELH